MHNYQNIPISFYIVLLYILILLDQCLPTLGTLSGQQSESSFPLVVKELDLVISRYLSVLRSSARSLNSTENGSESLSLPCSESLTNKFDNPRN